MKSPSSVPANLFTRCRLASTGRAVLCLAASLVWLLPDRAFAAGTAAEGNLALGGMGEASIKMFGTLLLVVGVIVLVFYIMKRFRLVPFQGGKEARMRLLGTLHLAPKRLVALVEVCGEWLVLGVGTESISLLSKVDPSAATEGNTAGGSADGLSFEGALRKRLFGSGAQQKGKSHGGV